MPKELPQEVSAVCVAVAVAVAVGAHRACSSLIEACSDRRQRIGHGLDVFLMEMP